MIVEITQAGGKAGRPWRGTVNDKPFVGTASFCRLVADMATPEDGCIKGIGVVNSSGYRMARHGKHKFSQHALARAAFEGMDRPPPGLQAAHGPCNDRTCINPHHVSFKTMAENQQDKVRDGTHTAGERHGMAKVTDAERAEIQRLYATGRYTQRELGQRFGIARRSVSRIVRPETWRVDPMTPERAALIRFITATAPYTARQVAEACNTTEQQVRNIKNGHRWNRTRKQVQS